MYLEIAPGVAIREDEIQFSASRGGGPGGQSVNTTSSRVILEFDVTASPSLSDQQKSLILRRLASRLSKDGRLRVVAATERSQLANRREATARLLDILAWALRPEPTPRRPTKPSKAARERRLTAKKQRGALKQARGKPGQDGE